MGVRDRSCFGTMCVERRAIRDGVRVVAVVGVDINVGCPRRMGDPYREERHLEGACFPVHLDDPEADLARDAPIQVRSARPPGLSGEKGRGVERCSPWLGGGH